MFRTVTKSKGRDREKKGVIRRGGRENTIKTRIKRNNTNNIDRSWW